MSAALSRISVLVVDDHAQMRQIVKEILRAFGITRLFEARDGAEALKLLKSAPIDIVMTDVTMPVCNGLTLIRAIRSSDDHTIRFMPIIVLSAYRSQRVIFEARDQGATEYVAKPVSVDGLYSRLAHVINHPRAFIRSKHFFGPDRRRRKVGVGQERRAD